MASSASTLLTVVALDGQPVMEIVPEEGDDVGSLKLMISSDVSHGRVHQILLEGNILEDSVELLSSDVVDSDRILTCLFNELYFAHASSAMKISDSGVEARLLTVGEAEEIGLDKDSNGGRAIWATAWMPPLSHGKQSVSFELGPVGQHKDATDCFLGVVIAEDLEASLVQEEKSRLSTVGVSLCIGGPESHYSGEVEVCSPIGPVFCKKFFGRNFSEGDIVTVELDFDSATVSFTYLETPHTVPIHSTGKPIAIAAAMKMMDAERWVRIVA